MKKINAEDPMTRSADLVSENTAQLRVLFPEAFTEGKVDFAVLRELLGDAVEDREERYGLDWHGKAEARRLALAASTGTLRPARSESVDWDTTRNLIIEGDNLEVLKLLQKSYARKVKMIYIDPPYNTGNDFVYPDDYRDNIANYLEISGQVDGAGTKINSNTETGGRFHTDWLNMMYPRLKLSRNLMSADGVIFTSIDDGEYGRLIALYDELFGEENFIGTFVWEKRTNRENRKMISSRHDYIVCYGKNKSSSRDAIGKLPMNEAALARYKNPDDDPRGPWKSDPASAQAGHGTERQFYVLNAPNGTKHHLQSGRCWVYTEPVMNEAIRDGRIWFGKDGNGVPRIKTYLNAKERGLVVESIWFAASASTNENAKNALKELFDGQAVFDTPKPVELVRQMLQVSAPEGIVLDFFAGSGTTGHAVLAQNVAASRALRYILIQLPEPLDPSRKGQKVASDFCDRLGKPRNLAELTKERLRRSANKLREENPLFVGDLGFRAFKLDNTNLRPWDPTPADLQTTIYDQIEHVKPDRSEEDLLFEVLLKLGIDLSVPSETRTIAGHEVQNMGAGQLMTCLASEIARDDVIPLARGIIVWHRESRPEHLPHSAASGTATLLFRDSAFVDDVAKQNLVSTLEQAGLTNVRSV